jgi:hypothetical protein
MFHARGRNISLQKLPLGITSLTNYTKLSTCGLLIDAWNSLWGYGVHRHLQHYFSYIVTVSFIGGRNRSTRGKPLTCHKSLTNFITQCCIKYTSQWVEFELKSLMAIGTHSIDPCEIETGISLSVKTWFHSSNMITFTNINEHSTSGITFIRYANSQKVGMLNKAKRLCKPKDINWIANTG